MRKFLSVVFSAALSCSIASQAVKACPDQNQKKPSTQSAVPQQGAVEQSQATQQAVIEQTQTTTTVTTKRPRIGLALGGGGTRGAAHVGVLKVLRDAGIPIDLVAGTSMGAIVGGLYCAGVPLDQIQTKFDDDSLMHSFMTVPLKVRIVAAPVLVLPRVFGYHPYDGLYKGNEFRKYINKSLPACEQNIEALKMPFSAVALNIRDGKVCRIDHGSLGYALQASSAVPGLRKPVQIGDQLFVDGGVVANVPVKQARDMGADIVIAVDVDERFDEEPLDAFRAIGSVSKRMVTLQLASMDEHLTKDADVVIHPNVDGIGLVSTHRKDAVRAIAAGEEAAKAALPAIRARLAAAGVSCVAVQPKVQIQAESTNQQTH